MHAASLWVGAQGEELEIIRHISVLGTDILTGFVEGTQLP